MAQGDVPTSRGGPLRRRRDKRQLEQLADASVREGTPRSATAHVKVIEPQVETPDREFERQEPEPTADVPREHPIGGFHVRPVPIDEPIGE
ncbi:MAG: hypothetical protein JO368_05410 [Acidimicrobiales bacterium]|nr:hypothetical protein [Acidimicrobiales bacterium]